MENDKALRPTMPADAAGQDRWLRARQVEAMLQLSTAAQQLTVAVRELHQLVSLLLTRAEPAE